MAKAQGRRSVPRRSSKKRSSPSRDAQTQLQRWNQLESTRKPGKKGSSNDDPHLITKSKGELKKKAALARGERFVEPPRTTDIIDEGEVLKAAKEIDRIPSKAQRKEKANNIKEQARRALEELLREQQGLLKRDSGGDEASTDDMSDGHTLASDLLPSCAKKCSTATASIVSGVAPTRGKNRKSPGSLASKSEQVGKTSKLKPVESKDIASDLNSLIKSHQGGLMGDRQGEINDSSEEDEPGHFRQATVYKRADKSTLKGTTVSKPTGQSRKIGQGRATSRVGGKRPARGGAKKGQSRQRRSPAGH